MTLSHDPPQGTAASKDVDDQLMLGDMADEDTFEIPLKRGNSRPSNFSELSEGLVSPPDIYGGNVEKKVRFEPGDEAPAATEHLHPRSRAGSMRGKKNVEDLLQYANQVNDYLAQNLENINTFRSELLSSDYPTKPRSDIATQATSVSASMSNFELSDNESEEQDGANPDLTGGAIYNGDLSALNKSDDSLLRTVPRNVSSPGSSSLLEIPSVNHTLENSPQINNTEVLNSPELGQYLKPSPGKCVMDEPDDANRSLVLDNGNPDDKESEDRASEDLESLELPPEQGMQVIQDTIDLILRLSSASDVQADAQENAAISSSEYANFNMKSTPTVTYKQFISRIQAKCMFGSIVYLAAAYLIQTLFLTRDRPGGSLILRLHLEQCHTHRLVAATVRVATKLLEDFVHSHQYFCKVCGVSKRLLTRLEVSLIICLKHDGLVITSGKLAATRQIRDELMRNETI